MDVIEYLAPSTIPDIATRHTLATTITPITDQRLHNSIVSASLGGKTLSFNENRNNNNNNKTSTFSVNDGTREKLPILVNDLNANNHLSAPTVTDSSLFAASMSSSNSANGFSNIFQLGNSVARILPKTAALLQQKVCQYVPLLWKVSPPVVHVNPLAAKDHRAEQLQNFFGTAASSPNPKIAAVAGARTASTVARFVALHPHRRLIAVATPHEGSSSHSAIVVYDLSEQEADSNNNNVQPKQVLRNIVIKDLCGIAWKPGSRNVLVAHGVLGVSLFHLSIDPKTGLDMEDSKNRNLLSGNNNSNIGGGNNNNNNTKQSHPAFVLPAAGSATNTASPVMRNATDLGVSCMYPVSAQLARFGIEPQIDRVAFYPDSGRFLACASTSSSGIRIIDLAFSPMEQLYSTWANTGSISNNNKSNNNSLKPTNKLVSGTFCGSPVGGTIDLAWIHPSTETSTTLLLLRAVKDSKTLELFAAGLTTPIAQLDTEHPIEQIDVSMWPNFANVANQSSLDNRNASLGLDAKSNPSLPEPRPNRHVPLWVLYQRAEGVVLYDLAFNEQTLHQQSPIHCLPLIRLSTTVASPVRQQMTMNNNIDNFNNNNIGMGSFTHPGGIVSRFVTVKEIGSSDSGTIFMSVDSGHVVSVKISRNGMQQTQNTANSSFVYQTTIISPTLDDDDEDSVSVNSNSNNNSSKLAFSELVGVFGSTAQPFGMVDAHSLVTWNGQENVAKLISVKLPKCEKNFLPDNKKSSRREFNDGCVILV